MTFKITDIKEAHGLHKGTIEGRSASDSAQLFQFHFLQEYICTNSISRISTGLPDSWSASVYLPQSDDVCQYPTTTNAERKLPTSADIPRQDLICKLSKIYSPKNSSTFIYTSLLNLTVRSAIVLHTACLLGYIKCEEFSNP